MPKVKRKDITVNEHSLITLSDGIRLAAKSWMPTDAQSSPVPAILEYLPYRKRDGTIYRDSINCPFIASHGYAYLRVDIRGSGESDGFLEDEYTPQEQKDGVELINWIAEQPWCNGKVAMMGISWGGFNALQIAAHAPKSLKTIISLCSTPNRYTDDIHYIGGSLLNDNFQWSAIMWAMMSRAPDPLLVGEEHWMSIWQERLNRQPLMASKWLQHPTYDNYWKQGSICESYDKITCSVYVVGGFADGYTNTIPNMLSNLSCPRKGLIGPWKHMYPNLSGKPGPSIGFLTEALRWFDYWLKNIDTGIMNEPMYRVWMQDSVMPNSAPSTRLGRWVAQKEVPGNNITAIPWFLNQYKQLTPSSPDIYDTDFAITHCSSQIIGLDGGAWCGYGQSAEKPGDQRMDDGLSLCFDSEPLKVPLEILGFTEVHLDLSVDKPKAFIAVRLTEVLPNGSSLLLAYGILNLNLRNGYEREVPIIPYEKMSVVVQLKNTANHLNSGSRIRIAISTTYWPMVFPTAEPVTLNVFPNSSKIMLPVRSAIEEDFNLLPFAKPDGSPPLKLIYSRPASGKRHVHRDIETNIYTYVVEEDSGNYLNADTELQTDYKQIETYTIQGNNPLSATVEIKTDIILSRNEWKTRTELYSKMTADAQTYFLEAHLVAYHNEKKICERHLKESISRNSAPQNNFSNSWNPKLFSPSDTRNIVSQEQSESAFSLI